MSERGQLERSGVADGGHLDVDHEAATTTIVLHGEVDASRGGQLTTLVEASNAAGYAVTVDLAGVTFMDSAGAAFLVRLYKGIAPKRVTVVRPSASVLYVLNVTQLSQVLDVDSD